MFLSELIFALSHVVISFMLSCHRIELLLQGYFQILFNCIEKLLAFFNVKRFVLPATDAARSMWTEKFGFEKISKEQVHKQTLAWVRKNKKNK